MMYAAIDIHKSVFQVAVLDGDSGALEQERFAAERERLDDWAMRWQGRLAAVAIEATTGRGALWAAAAARGWGAGWSAPPARAPCGGGGGGGAARAGRPAGGGGGGGAPLPPPRPPLPGAADDLRGRPDHRLPPAGRDRRG